MGKRTSDFVALATILGGVGVGFGVTSLFAGSAPVRVDTVSVDDVSVEVRVVPGRVLVRDGSATSTIYFRSRAGAEGFTRLDPDTRGITIWSPSGELRIDVEDREREVREIRGVEVRLMAEMAEELEREAQELYEEALEELDCLEATARGDEDEDQRRRRRRRRPCR